MPHSEKTASAPIRQLGELTTSAQGLGCMGLSEFRGPVEPGEAIRAVQRALDLGVTMLDTADIYGQGRNERLVGRAVRGRRDEVVIATKCGIVRKDGGDGGRAAADGGGDAGAGAGAGAGRRLCGTRQHVKESCEQSLARLDVDRIDLFYLHRADPDTPIEESMLGMADLVAEGKIWHVGLSEADPETIRRAHKVLPITALQNEWSLWSREVEGEVLSVCRELGIGVVAFSPLARGLLSGGIRRLGDLADSDERRINPRFAPGNFDRNMRLVSALDTFATELGITLAQLALAWVHHQGGDVVPIPGAERCTHVEENVKAAEVRLSAEELAVLERLSPTEAVAGHRMDSVRSYMLPGARSGD
jgi:aryl-alcohol dehydrogenase-like predicted oxidoreductase